MRVSIAVTLGLVALAALAPTSAQQAVKRSRTAVPRDTAVPFKVGETLTFDVSWSSYMVAGTAVATVRERRDGSGDNAAYYIVAEGKPLPLISRLYSLYYKMDTLLDTVTLLPQQVSLYSEEGRRQRLGTTRFDRAARRATFEMSGEPPIKTNVAVPAQAQDGLSMLYAVRAKPLTPGTTMSFPVLDEGSLYTVSLKSDAVERVRVPLGEMSAAKLTVTIVDSQGTTIGDNIGVWISNDARRLPVKMQAELPVGTFLLALREAR